MRRLFFLLSLLVTHSLFAQKLDSLLMLAKSQRDDTSKVKTLIYITEEYGKQSIQSALPYGMQAIELAKQLGYTEGLMLAHISIGIAYTRANQFNEALAHYTSAIQFAKQLNNQRGLARCYNNMAIIYYSQSDYPKALECNLMALKINESLGYKKGIARNLTNLANVYDSKGDPDRALGYYQRAIVIMEELKDLAGVASQLDNMGVAWFNKKDFGRALEYQRRALVLQRSQQDTAAISTTLSTLANTYKYLHKPDSALLCYREAIMLDEKTGRTRGLAINTGNLAAMLIEQGKIAEGIGYCNRAIALARGQGLLTVLHEAYGNLSAAYEAKGDARQALVFYKEYVRMRDSIFNEENTKKMVRSEMNFEFEKKEAAARLEQEKKDAVASAEARRQRIILLSISGFGLLVLGFAAFAWRSLVQKKKANEEISRQKHLIEAKQKEILDSIYYARRIQRSLLPSERAIQKIFHRITG
jgi:tetratricopeptide (TPR) repeat protein